MAVEAVCYVLDASPSMNSPLLRGGGDEEEDKIGSSTTTTTTTNTTGTTTTKPTSRLSFCKESVSSLLAELMFGSSYNVASVIVCKTRQSSNHLDPPTPHLTALTHGFLEYPSVDLIQTVGGIETLKDQDEVEKVCGNDGDVWAGISLATDALWEKARARKVSRKVVVFTDAVQNIAMDPQHAIAVIEKLQSMNAKLEIVGFDFDILSGSGEKGKDNDNDSDSEDDSGSETEDEDEEEGSDDDDDDDDENILTDKKHKERFLNSLAQRTGGKVVAASTWQQAMEATKGRKASKSTKSKFDLSVAPGITVKAKSSILMKSTKPDSLKKAVVLLNEDGSFLKNDLGDEITEEIKTVTLYFEPDSSSSTGSTNNKVHVEPKDRARAARFGTDLIAWDDFVDQGVKTNSTYNMGVRMEILRYIDREQIPNSYLIGPPSIVTGSSSLYACTVIASLAQALERQKKVAICTNRRTKNGPLKLVALFPFVDEELEESKPTHLAYMQIPYAGEVRDLERNSFEVQDDKLQVSDDLIDSLMLPDDVLGPGQVPNPYLRSFNQTKIKRAIDPESEPVFTRYSSSSDQQQRQQQQQQQQQGAATATTAAATLTHRRDGNDPTTTPNDILTRSKDALETFRDEFPLKTKTIEVKQKRKGKASHHYKEYL